MSSLGEIREALSTATERTAEARGHALRARSGLDEVARLLGDLSGNAVDLPHADVERARRDLDDALGIIHDASELVADLGARL